MDGWIKLHRKIMDWEWYTDSNTVHLFLHLMLIAQRRPTSFRGVQLSRGQLITGRKALSKQTGLSERSIRTCLDHLKATNEVTSKPTSQFSILTVVNYSTYNPENLATDQQTDQQTANDRPTTDQRPTTCKKVKERKTVKKTTKGGNFIKPTAQEVDDYAKSISFQLDGQYFINYNDARGWMIGKNKMKDWKATVRTWKQNEEKRNGGTQNAGRTQGSTPQRPIPRDDFNNQTSKYGEDLSGDV